MTLFTSIYHDLTHGRLAMLVRLVPLVILGCAGVGGVVGLIAGLQVLVDACQLIAAAAVPLLVLIMWPEYARFAKKRARDERSRE